MLNSMTGYLDFHAKALVLRAQRQQLIASNIANADTPGYVARDLNFKQAMGNAMATASAPSGGLSTTSTHAGHIASSGLSGSTLQLGAASQLGYAVQSQPSMDNNSVDLDRERANFVDNTVRYEATLRFINGDAKTLLSAIQGQ
jgi:flagellar basal-body rod protein FlgB